MNFFSRLWTLLQETAKRPIVAPVLAAIAVLLFLQFGSLRLVYWSQDHGQDWVQPIRNVSEIPLSAFGKAFSATEQEKARLEEQFRDMRARTRHHLDVMVDFYGWYYMAIIMMSICGAVAAMMLFWITKNGWTNPKPAAVVVFVIMTTAAIYYRTFPGMFRQEENIATNRDLYLQYVRLQNELRSYCVTGQDVEGKKQPASKFIHYLDNRMAILNQIAIGLDPTKVSTFEDLQKQVNQSQKQP